MKRFRRGFTLVEVSLFLAITAAIFVGIAVGTQNSIFQQRYNDAVQNFAEFLRSVYSQVTNVQNFEGNGMHDEAIYGKLVVFGEDGGNNKIVTYDVIGDIENESCNSEATVLGKLNCLGTDVGGSSDIYKPRWASQIQTVAAWDEEAGGYTLFTGALLVVRHPSSGTVHTYVYRTRLGETVDFDNPFGLGEGGNNLFTNGSFSQDDVDFCVNPNGGDRSNLRRDVRIVGKARNASGVEIIQDSQELDASGNNVGNRCE